MADAAGATAFPLGQASGGRGVERRSCGGVLSRIGRLSRARGERSRSAGRGEGGTGWVGGGRTKPRARWNRVGLDEIGPFGHFLSIDPQDWGEIPGRLSPRGLSSQKSYPYLLISSNPKEGVAIQEGLPCFWMDFDAVQAEFHREAGGDMEKL